jgi:hypothetical protein
MKAQLASTEEGVFRDVIDRTIEGLCDKVDAWQTEGLRVLRRYRGDLPNELSGRRQRRERCKAFHQAQPTEGGQRCEKLARCHD